MVSTGILTGGSISPDDPFVTAENRAWLMSLRSVASFRTETTQTKTPFSLNGCERKLSVLTPSMASDSEL